ncbi:MAG: hypothetical protein DSM106950_42250 [Stigonema ocellatum SAG 48.90 = DSM 106950]|nr:hypothetical protein [Stigonema ocellatum SAG 48.90 = DSM 106950]
MTFQPQPDAIDQLIEQVVHHCQTRHPEALDNIFDNLPVSINEQVLESTLAILSSDINQFSWFCGYMAGEINRTEDNYKPRHPIAELSKILIAAGMQPFIDFTPYPGCRLVIANVKKFESLPEDVLAVVREVFDFVKTPDQQIQEINDALLQELVISGE